MNKETFDEFEKKILNTENTGSIKYSVDKNIEAAVKLQFLFDSYGQDRVESAMKELGMSLGDLANLENFEKVSKAIAI